MGNEEITFDPTTLHGTHYSEEDFDREVDRLVNEWVAQEKAEGEHFTEADINSLYTNYRRELYIDWNNCDTDQYIRFSMANSMKYDGIAASGFTTEDNANPLLAPIHGISLRDYCAMAAKIASEVPVETVCKAMGIDKMVWDEVNTLWPKRMQEDGSYTVITLYGQYFMEAGEHPKLQNLETNISETGKKNLLRMKEDRYFYEELAGARQAAYEYGLDGAQWILDNFGIGLGEFQTVAAEIMTERNKNFNAEEITHFQNYQEQKQQEYAEKFAAEQGGNIADDVEF
jgi:hypothetical protein